MWARWLCGSGSALMGASTHSSYSLARTHHLRKFSTGELKSKRSGRRSDLTSTQYRDVVDYDIDMYAERLDDILSKKIKMYTQLHANLKQFRQHLAQEEAISQSIRHVQQY